VQVSELLPGLGHLQKSERVLGRFKIDHKFVFSQRLHRPDGVLKTVEVSCPVVRLPNGYKPVGLTRFGSTFMGAVSFLKIVAPCLIQISFILASSRRGFILAMRDGIVPIRMTLRFLSLA
jgi:hypothetical protein